MNIKFKLSQKQKAIIRFYSILVLLIVYGGYVTFHYGAKNGFLITLLTWSFFVFCTPIADAGFLIDFPIRLITKIKMLHTEIIVWIFAGIVNIYAYLTNTAIYSKTIILQLFYHIISKPFPYWSLIILSAIGTFLSIHLGDELFNILDKKFHKKKLPKHKSKYYLIMFLFIIILIIILYDFLIHEIGISTPIL